MVVHKELRCPACGALSAVDHSTCPVCGGPLAPHDALDVDDILSDISQLIDDLAKEAPSGEGRGAEEGGTGPEAPTAAPSFAKRKNEEARAGIERALQAPPAGTTGKGPAPGPMDGGAGAGRAAPPDEAEEAYQCLICGSTIAADSDKCHVCGTIFVDEAEAGSYRGLPVARLGGASEIDAEDSDLRQAHRAEEIKVEPPPPGPGARPRRLGAEEMPQVEFGLRTGPGKADELPAAEFEGLRGSSIRKKIVKKTPRKQPGPSP